MIVIRIEQQQALQAELRRSLISALAASVRQHFAGQVEAWSDARLEEHVAEALREAEGYGLTRRRDLATFVNLTVVHGRGWGADPALAWLHELLSDRAVAAPSDRLRRALRETVLRLDGAGQ